MLIPLIRQRLEMFREERAKMKSNLRKVIQIETERCKIWRDRGMNDVKTIFEPLVKPDQDPKDVRQE